MLKKERIVALPIELEGTRVYLFKNNNLRK